MVPSYDIKAAGMADLESAIGRPWLMRNQLLQADRAAFANILPRLSSKTATTWGALGESASCFIDFLKSRLGTEYLPKCPK